MTERTKALGSDDRFWQRPRGRGEIGRRAPSAEDLGRGRLNLHSSVVTLADQMLVSGSNFVSTALIARALGLESFGWFTLVWIAVLFAGSLQLGIIVSPMMSIGAKQEHDHADRYFGVIVAHEVLFCGLATPGICLVVAWLLPPAGTLAMVPFAAGAAGGAYLAQDFTRRLLFARLRSRAVFGMDLVNQVMKLVLVIGFWRVQALNVEGALWAVAAAASSSTLVGALFVGTLRFDQAEFWPVTVRQWNSARWLTGTALMQWATSNSAFVMTASVLGPTTVGALRAATTVLGVINISREAIENILPQHAGRALSSAGLPGLRSVLVRTALLSMAFGGMVVVVLALLGGTVLRLVYGSGFDQYGFVIGWLSLMFPFWLMNLTLICGFRALERTMPVFAAATAATAFNVVSMYPAVKIFGVAGAIGVMVASDCLIAAILACRIRVEFAKLGGAAIVSDTPIPASRE